MGGGNYGQFDEFCVDLDAVLWVGWGVGVMGRGGGVDLLSHFGKFKTNFRAFPSFLFFLL